MNSQSLANNQQLQRDSKKKEVREKIIFCSYELTDRREDAKIISFNFIMPKFVRGELDYSRLNVLCGNKGRKIDDMAFKHHRISEQMLRDKTPAKNIRIPLHDKMVVWDGFITNIRFTKNNIRTPRYRIIDLHSLYRYSTKLSYKTKLSDALRHVLADSHLNVDEFMSNSKNKVMALCIIYDYLLNFYKNNYGITSLTDLTRISKAGSKKEAMRIIRGCKDVA